MADLLLPGVELPQNGVMLRINVSGDGFFCVVVDDWPTVTGKAVELPDHGRLIDADEFESHVQNQWELNEISNGDWIQFREWLKDQQTIIPASKEGGE